MVTKIDNLFFLIDIPLEWCRIELKQLLQKMKMTKKLENIKNILSMVVYM